MWGPLALCINHTRRTISSHIVFRSAQKGYSPKYSPMLIAKRAARFFERLVNPDEQAQAPKGVLLYSPNLLRFVAALCYLIWLAGFVNNFFISDFFRRSFSDRQLNDLFYSQFALV